MHVVAAPEVASTRGNSRLDLRWYSETSGGGRTITMIRSPVDAKLRRHAGVGLEVDR